MSFKKLALVAITSLLFCLSLALAGCSTSSDSSENESQTSDSNDSFVEDTLRFDAEYKEAYAKYIEELSSQNYPSCQYITQIDADAIIQYFSRMVADEQIAMLDGVAMNTYKITTIASMQNRLSSYDIEIHPEDADQYLKDMEARKAITNNNWFYIIKTDGATVQSCDKVLKPELDELEKQWEEDNDAMTSQLETLQAEFNRGTLPASGELAVFQTEIDNGGIQLKNCKTFVDAVIDRGNTCMLFTFDFEFIATGDEEAAFAEETGTRFFQETGTFKSDALDRILESVSN